MKRNLLTVVALIFVFTINIKFSNAQDEKKEGEGYSFTIIKEKDKQIDWQFDYYSKSKDKITCFIIKDKEIQKKEAEIFRKDQCEILKLDLNHVKIPIEKALEKINQKTKEKPNEIIIVLQVINKKETWNITYLTTSFKTINTKINTKSGKIISQEEASLFGTLRLGDFIKKK